jgi:hypothetical protein
MIKIQKPITAFRQSPTKKIEGDIQPDMIKQAVTGLECWGIGYYSNTPKLHYSNTPSSYFLKTYLRATQNRTF